MKPQEIFKYIKPEYKYIAMARHGEWYAYEIIPQRTARTFAPAVEDVIYTCIQALPVEYEGDWKDSLMCRDDIEEKTPPPSCSVQYLSPSWWILQAAIEEMDTKIEADNRTLNENQPKKFNVYTGEEE